MTPNPIAPKILRGPAVDAISGLSKSTRHNHIAEGLMVKPVAPSARAVGFPEHEVHAIVRARIAGKTTDEIKLLVTSLMAARKNAS